MTCIQCAQIKTHQGGRPMLRQGFSGCAKRPVYEFFAMNSERQCGEFAQANAAAMEKRAGLIEGDAAMALELEAV